MRKFLIAALFAVITIAGVSAYAEAKVYDVEIGGEKYAVDYGARPADTKTSWKKDGHNHTYVWANADRTAVDLYIDGKLEQPVVKTRKIVRPTDALAAKAAVTPATGVVFEPRKPETLWSRFRGGISWFLKGMPAEKLQIPKAAVEAVAPIAQPTSSVQHKAVPPMKEPVAKTAKQRVRQNKAPPKAKKPGDCEQDIRLMLAPVRKPVEVATPKIPQIQPGQPPAQDVAKATPRTAKPVIVTKPPSQRTQEVEYLLFDQRSYEELRQIAREFQREEGGELVVLDLQDRGQEYRVPKARFFERRSIGGQPVFYRPLMMIPTKELLNASESKRLPNSPGFQIKKKKG